MKFYDLDREDNLLFETQSNDFDVYDCVKRKGKYYTIGSKSLVEDKCGVHKIELDFENDCEYREDNIICPVCGHNDFDSFEINESDDYQCGFCGAILEVHREFLWTTSLKELPNIKEMKGEK